METSIACRLLNGDDVGEFCLQPVDGGRRIGERDTRLFPVIGSEPQTARYSSEIRGYRGGKVMVYQPGEGGVAFRRKLLALDGALGVQPDQVMEGESVIKALLYQVRAD
jgi:hypothetical protein